MKELSIEEKAKRYDEALKAVIVAYKDEDRHLKATLERIFPELKESEDEKIKKRIIALINAHGQGRYKEEMLAWFEKQDKQEPFNYENINIQQKDFAPKSALEAINEEKVDNANKVEPRQEELTEFEKAVKQVLEEAIECGDTRNLKADAEMLLSLAHKSAWSEEDEKILSDIVKDLVHPWNEYIPDRVEDEIKWLKNRLKSLKNRVQPKQEWSEEDKKIIDRIESEFLALHRGEYKNIDFNNVDSLSVLNWVRKIKSLSFQSRWKPSDEQIKVLVEVLIFAANHESPHWNDYIFGILKNLTRQLKKLREE